MDHAETFRALAIEAAKRYAAADRSDPFAFSRAMTHINNGIVRPTDDLGRRVWYDATAATEMREIELSTGKEMVPFTVYRNVCRP